MRSRGGDYALMGSPYSRDIALRLITHCFPNLRVSTPGTIFPYAMALRSVDSLSPQSSLASENDISPSKGVATSAPAPPQKKLVAGEVKVVIPDDAVTALVDSHAAEESLVI